MRVFNRLTWLIVVGVVVTTTLPVVAAINLARAQAAEREQRYALDLAERALARAEAIAEQLLGAARALNKLDEAAACGPAGLEEMRSVDLRSDTLQAIGWAEGDTMLCASFSGARAYPLGPVDFRSGGASVYRLDVNLIDPNTAYLAVQIGHVVGIVDRDLPLNFMDDVRGKVSIVSWAHKVPLISRNVVPPELLTGRLKAGSVFRYRGQLVAVVKSKKFDLAAVVVLPEDYAADYAGETALLLLPLGLLVGLILSALLVYVIRSRLSMPAMIRSAIVRRRFHLLYQPLVELESGRIVGAEALIRWDRGSAGEIPTDRFIDAAEEAGLVPLITAHVFELLAEDAGAAVRKCPISASR